MNKNISGTVEPHQGNGRRFGYPTANINCPADLDEGIFIGYTSIEGEPEHQNMPSMIYVGTSETLHELNKRLESHILDFEDRDLYGKNIQVNIVEKVRASVRFDGTEELIEQMQRDERDIREWFQQSS